ncbi:hypothetical protein [Streptomyces sp. CHB9.2]|uniref:hypothetical protein n=1 Tax=Streptomyces sp. CHB9.2 TaxID=2841670 RepID=UPI0020951CD2|nr:hypothetical protein [Streptomyces sp. CHB9.2]MCO6704782.1 hypothetical protein [Streptomyces sp. CHB9.2]
MSQRSIDEFNHKATIFCRNVVKVQLDALKAKGIELPQIKGVRFKRQKPKVLRNTVSRVVMVGFDPFNQSGLPEHIEKQVVHDYLMAEERAFVQAWVNQATDGEIRFGAIIG